MIVELELDREKKTATSRIIYQVTVYDSGIEDMSEKVKKYTDVKLLHTGEAYALVKDDVTDDIKLTDSSVIAMFPKSITIITYL